MPNRWEVSLFCFIVEIQQEGSDKIDAISQWQHAPCECGQGACADLTRSFNALNDQR